MLPDFFDALVGPAVGGLEIISGPANRGDRSQKKTLLSSFEQELRVRYDSIGGNND